MALFGLRSVEFLNAQLCTTADSTHTPCVLTAGYAGPASDANFNKRQALNPYEFTFSPTALPSSQTGALFEVDDGAPQLPSAATSNPIMAEPLYVAGITVSNPSQGTCNPCNMVVAVTLNDTVFAWNADGSGAGNVLWSRKGVTGSTTNPPGNAGNALWYDDCGGSSGAGPVTLTNINLQFQGILSTPVIDASGTTPVMFLTSYCQVSANHVNTQWWLHEIDLTTGKDVMVSGATQNRRIGGTTGDFSSLKEGWQFQRPALLQVKNSAYTSTPNLIYLLFGTGAPENHYLEPYSGWAVAYTNGSSGLSPVFAYKDQPSSCGTGGGYGNTTNPQCNVNPNSGSPACDCYVNNTTLNAPNWGGHGGGCWMSGNGPAATAANAIGSDNAVHVFFGCGNGGFQNSGLGGTANDNFGQTVMDFRLTSSGYDSNSTGPFQTFTPYSPAYGIAPPLPSNVCGYNPANQPPTFGTCNYTVQTMNAYDYDQAVSGVVLLNDLNNNKRALTIDKAGYGYLMTQGSLCGSGFTADTQCIGFASGDPGSWTFVATNMPCTGASDACHRVPSLSLTDNRDEGFFWAVYMNYWPYNEKLTALEMSDNSMLQNGTHLLTTYGLNASALDLSGGCTPPVNCCTLGVNCLPDQVIPGDSLSLNGCTCQAGSACPPIITSVSTSQIKLNMTVATAFGSSCSFAQSFGYAGYFVTPAHDNATQAPNAGYPGGALMASADCSTNDYCTNQLIWAVVPDSSAKANSTQRGLGTLYAYTALPNSNDILAQDWKSAATDIWCASSFARPTIVNARAFVPTYMVSHDTRTFSSCPTSASTPYASGILRYH